MPIKFVLKHNLPAKTTNAPQLAEYDFDGDFFTVGSNSENNLVLNGILPEQVVVVRENGQIRLINGGEGTVLNRKKLPREAMVPLSVGDKIKVGEYVILVTDDSVPEVAPIPRPAKDLPIAKPSNPLPVIISAPAAENPAAASDNIEKDLENSEPPKPARNFADILDTLRTDDDSFYFTIRQGERELGKIMLNQPETPLGTNERGVPATGETVKNFFAVAKKDWSGISIESPDKKFVSVNKEALKSIRKLRHDDAVVFGSAPKFSLVLHEPGALVALESILATRSNQETQSSADKNASAAGKKASASKTERKSLKERKYFNNFSFIEITAMILATLIGAIIIFLILEFVIS